MTADTLAIERPYTESFEDAIYRKVNWRIVPLFIACFLFAYLDRVNISFAKLQMQTDLGFSDTVYGLGASLFFVGYFLFEVPSNMLLHKIGARVWIARIMVTWGITSACMMFVQNEFWFYSLRFLIGVMEAGFVPGVLYFFTQWYPSNRRARVNSYFKSSICLCGIVGGPIAGLILGHFNGVLGMEGWRWLFLLEGIPSILLGGLVFWLVSDRIEDAPWLDAEEKQVMRERMAKETKPAGTQRFADIWKHPTTYVMSGIYLCLVMALTGVLFWMPQLIKTAGVADTLDIGLLTVIPYVIAVIGNLLVGASSDRHGERRWHMAGCSVLTAAGYLVCALYPGQLVPLMIGMSMILTGIIAWMPIFWTIPPRFLNGLAAAAGIALINSLGQLGGIIAPFMVGRIKDLTGTATPALYVLGAVTLVATGLIIWGIPARYYVRETVHD
ncbi:MFS transporter [Pseudomonas sp. CCI3.2]|uniref:MFS transporter n=1 Tax=unclassified Pseudomonas TaxID=196821 RepID=UPI002AC94CF5|nr:MULTISPECIES: MFS transporter [unclassified Pseudomonas]MEB0080153.1 MFS transporter [Pseudomonas sp. MH10out]MEB0104112.1 MFS transporter [Pseudomonas sp. CCI3.2]MEB0133291.1 MFS transporter [Pseudomonas sp. CCI2.4]MEB0160459.1 MFS transporter [Pseudomonas sp. AH2 (2023)]MEB0170026.1 MFS transporter [Pseudomonas sp. CCC4.4]